MKKVAFVSLNDHVPWGGSEVLWSEVCARLAQSATCEVAISPRKWDAGPERVDQLLEMGAKDYRRTDFRHVRILKKIAANLAPRYSSAIYCLRSYKILTDFRPDLVLISLGDHNLGGDWMHMCQKLAIPYIVIVQLVKEAYYPPSDGPYAEFFENLKQGYRQAERILCASFDNEFLLEKQFACRFSNTLIINNPIRRVDPVPPYPASETSQWAMVANLNPNHKGQDILFDVLRADKWKNRSLHVNLYGSGIFEGALRKLADHWKLKNVSFHGFKRIENIWQVNQLLVLPTRAEGLSLAFLEAMSCERAAIISRLGDAERFIEDGQTGFLIGAPQSDMLDEAMERAWKQRDHWEQMGKKARRNLHSIVSTDPVSTVADLVGGLLR